MMLHPSKEPGTPGAHMAEGRKAKERILPSRLFVKLLNHPHLQRLDLLKLSHWEVSFNLHFEIDKNIQTITTLKGKKPK
jgi:hypothetical protein